MIEAILATLKAAFLAVPLTWYPAPGECKLGHAADPPETPEAFKARKDMVAVQVTEAIGARAWSFPAADMAALVGVTILKESALEYWVHAGGDSHLAKQDGGKARCLGQLHQNGRTPADWRALAGLDVAATYRCALAIAEAFEYHVKRCQMWTHQDMTAVQANILFHRYWKGNGPCSTHPHSRIREARWEKMRWKISMAERRLKKLTIPKKSQLKTFDPALER